MPKVVPYKKDSIIYFAGDRDDGRIFILQSGSISLISNDLVSDRSVAEELHNGEFFGVKSTFAHFPRMETASVVTDSVVVVLTLQEFEKVFGPNEAVILKMLRVFSQELRDIHKKTEAILNDNTAGTPSAVGMYYVAQAFFDEENFYSASCVLEKLLKKYPKSEVTLDAQGLYEKANRQIKLAKKGNEAVLFDDHPSDKMMGALRQFSLPIFDRFSRNYRDGEVIISEFEEGENFYLIQSGQIQLVKYINGATKNLDILRPGEFFGEMAILDNSQRSATCMARGPAQCLEFNKDNFKILITSNPQIAMILFRNFCKRIYDQRRRFKILVIKDLAARVADVFLMYNETTPHKESDETVKRRFLLTVNDVAQWAGITREEAQAELDRYAKVGKIEIFETYMIIYNILDMKRIVDGYYTALDQKGKI